MKLEEGVTIWGHRSAQEEGLHQAHEAIVVLGNPGGRIYCDELIIPGVDIGFKKSSFVQYGLQGQEQIEMDKIRPPPALAFGQLPQGRVVDGRV